MIESYADAVAAVTPLLKADLLPARLGSQDATAFLVTFGHPKWIREGDFRFMSLGALVALVDKQTGRVEFVSGAEHRDRFAAMQPAS